ncbi:MAG: hypothetical protein IPO35_10165 [Uliginosibacterium sp.]|nr:hypothetical protein [Uliginosibacterium sp.]
MKKGRTLHEATRHVPKVAQRLRHTKLAVEVGAAETGSERDHGGRFGVAPVLFQNNYLF